jgi:hypothetical protein
MRRQHQFREVAFSEVDSRCGFRERAQAGIGRGQIRFREREGRSKGETRPAAGLSSPACSTDVVALASATLSQQTRRTYASKVRQFLAWLAGGELEGDPFGIAAGRDWAVRDYRGCLLSVLKPEFRSPVGVVGALIDYARISSNDETPDLQRRLAGRGWPRAFSTRPPASVGAPRA